MEPIKLHCVYEERTSKEGKPYKAVFIKISDNYERIVWLTVPEQALITQNIKPQNTLSK